MAIVNNISRPNEAPVDGDFVEIVHPSGAIERKYYSAEPVLEVEQAPTVSVTPAFDFYRKFTLQERIAIRTLAATDLIAEDFLATLNAAIAGGLNVRSDDHDLIGGLAYFESVPSGSPVLAQGRALELLA